jgi:O-antigen/teichoic acid export membrane protein
MGESLQSKTIKGVLWSAVERFSLQGIQFILGIILARMVAPAEYGLIALLTIFLTIAQTFIDSGFSNALIQKQNRTETDYSTVFYFNITVAFCIYGILFAASPVIAEFYKEPQLKTITRLIGLNIIVSSFSIVQRAKLATKLDFKTQTKASLISVTASGLCGVFLAYNGYGVWALAVQAMSSAFLNTLMLWIFTKWKPLLVFSWESFRELFSFGSKLLIGGLLHTIYTNLYGLVIGKKYSAIDVGYYNRANTFTYFLSINIIDIIGKALYPVQCQLQDDKKRLDTTFHNYLYLSCYIVFPLMTGLAILSRPLVLVLLTEKWLSIATLIPILCFARMWEPVMRINNIVLSARGRSDYLLKAEVMKKTIAIGIMLITISWNLRILCLGIAAYSFFDMFIIIHYTKKVINTGYIEQLKNIVPIILLNLVMGIIVFVSIKIVSIAWMQLILGISVGIVSYSGLSGLFKIKPFMTIVSLVKQYMKKAE